VTSEADRERLRRTFEGAAGSYQRARPEYPAELFDDLLAVTGLPPGDRVLEVGCATGKATLPLARRGFRVTCVELGADLARAARAFWSAEHVFPEDGDPIFGDLQDVYDEIGEGTPAGAIQPRPGELRSYEGEIAASGLFDPVHVRHFDWERRYDADQYIDLLETFSGHIVMAGWQRDRLYGAIRSRLAERPGGMLRRHWGAVLHIARRRD